jgi:predicted PurR-regulated permease PerM
MHIWEQSASQEASYVEKALGLVLLLILAVGCMLVLRAFLTALLLSIILCVSTWRLFRRIVGLLGGQRARRVLQTAGHTGWSVFVMAWNGLFVSSLDNVLRPYLISRGVGMTMVLIFLGVLGGLLAFGIVGVFFGPVLLAVTHTLFQHWGRASETAPGPA